MEIRSAKTSEAPQLRELRLRALADFPDAFGSSYEHEAASPRGWWENRDGAVFVAVDGERWLGMAGGLPGDGPATARLWGMWVAPEDRGRGAGSALVEAVAGWARSRGATQLELSLTDHAPDAAALYERLGFEPTGRREPMARKPHLIEVVLVLALREPLPAELPADPLALAAALPDEPRWVEARSLLLAGEGELELDGSAGGGVVLERAFPSGVVVGRPAAEQLGGLLAAVPDDFELVVQLDALETVRAALPGWKLVLVPVHSLRVPWPAGGAEPGVAVSEPPDADALAPMPREIRRYAAVAQATAISFAEGQAAAVCAAGSVTETLWDVGIDTLEDHRRRGYAAAAFRALASHMAAQGRQPIWAAEEDNTASMALAAKLGFEAVDRLAVLSAPGTSKAAG